MLTPKERYDIAMAKLEAAASWRQDLLVYLTVAFIVFTPSPAGPGTTSAASATRTGDRR